MIGRRRSRLAAEIILVSREGSDWLFKSLDGCFHDFIGATFVIPDHRLFLSRLWTSFDKKSWHQGSRRSLGYNDQLWKTFAENWIKALPAIAISQIAERICKSKSFENVELHPRLVINFHGEKVEMVGDMIAINYDYSKRRKMKLLKYDGNHGVLLWQEFNRRMRCLGYLETSRTVAVEENFNKEMRFCNCSEEEISFYIKKLIDKEKISLLSRSDANYRSFIAKADRVLNDHSLLHAVVGLQD